MAAYRRRGKPAHLGVQSVEHLDEVIRCTTIEAQRNAARVARLNLLGHFYTEIAARIGWNGDVDTMRTSVYAGRLELTRSQLEWLAALEVETARGKPLSVNVIQPESIYEQRCKDAAEQLDMTFTHDGERITFIDGNGNERRFSCWASVWRLYLNVKLNNEKRNRLKRARKSLKSTAANADGVGKEATA